MANGFNTSLIESGSIIPCLAWFLIKEKKKKYHKAWNICSNLKLYALILKLRSFMENFDWKIESGLWEGWVNTEVGRRNDNVLRLCAPSICVFGPPMGMKIRDIQKYEDRFNTYQTTWIRVGRSDFGLKNKI